MIVRNSIDVEVIVKGAVPLQDADAELGEVERILRMEQTGTACLCNSSRRSPLNRRHLLLAVRQTDPRAGLRERDSQALRQPQSQPVEQTCTDCRDSTFRRQGRRTSSAGIVSSLTEPPRLPRSADRVFAFRGSDPTHQEGGVGTRRQVDPGHAPGSQRDLPVLEPQHRAPARIDPLRRDERERQRMGEDDVGLVATLLRSPFEFRRRISRAAVFIYRFQVLTRVYVGEALACRRLRR